MIWTAEQTAALVEHYSTKGARFIAKLLGFTEKRVAAKAHYLGLRVEYIKWTPEHTAAMIEHYSARGPEFVVKLLGRSKNQVMSKASSLGLRVQFKTRNGVAIAVKPKSSEPSMVIAPPKRGPAHLDGPLVFTDKTRYVVCPSMLQSTWSNTHSSY